MRARSQARRPDAGSWTRSTDTCVGPDSQAAPWSSSAPPGGAQAWSEVTARPVRWPPPLGYASCPAAGNHNPPSLRRAVIACCSPHVAAFGTPRWARAARRTASMHTDSPPGYRFGLRARFSGTVAGHWTERAALHAVIDALLAPRGGGYRRALSRGDEKWPRPIRGAFSFRRSAPAEAVWRPVDRLTSCGSTGGRAAPRRDAPSAACELRCERRCVKGTTSMARFAVQRNAAYAWPRRARMSDGWGGARFRASPPYPRHRLWLPASLAPGGSTGAAAALRQRAGAIRRTTAPQLAAFDVTRAPARVGERRFADVAELLARAERTARSAPPVPREPADPTTSAPVRSPNRPASTVPSFRTGRPALRGCRHGLGRSQRSRCCGVGALVHGFRELRFANRFLRGAGRPDTAWDADWPADRDRGRQ